MSAPTTAAEVLAAHQRGQVALIREVDQSLWISCQGCTYQGPIDRPWVAHQADALREVFAGVWDEGATAEAHGAGFEPALELNPYREGGDPRRERPAVRTTVEWGIKALFDRGTILPKPEDHALDAVRRFPDDWALVRRTVTDWTQVHP